MIQVQITPNRIHMSGHAGHMVNGQDIVCSAISALTYNLISSLYNLTEDNIRSEESDGMTIVEWEDLSDGGKLLLDSWLLGISEINNEYNCIQFVP